MTDLVPIPPRERFGTNVQICVLRALRHWWHVLPVLPVLVPEVLGVEGREDDGRCHNAVDVRRQS